MDLAVAAHRFIPLHASALVVGFSTLLTSMLVAISLGAADISTADVWASVWAHLSGSGSGLTPLRDGIIWELRAPRVITAAAVGAGLALTGSIMQATTRNRLADPYLLGLSSGASLGAVTVLLVGLASLVPIAAFMGALAAMVVTLGLARSLGTVTPATTILSGIAVSSLAAALTSFVVFWNATGDSYREILSWLLGSLGGSGWTQAKIAVYGLLAVGVPMVLASRVLDAFVFGDDAAAALGVRVQRTRWLFLGGSALLTGAMVSVSGCIGFVGLVVPHAARRLFGAASLRVLPLSALMGAVVLVWADTIARTAFAPRELPVGIITAFLGAPVFALILWSTRRQT